MKKWKTTPDDNAPLSLCKLLAADAGEVPTVLWQATVNVSAQAFSRCCTEPSSWVKDKSLLLSKATSWAVSLSRLKSQHLETKQRQQGSPHNRCYTNQMRLVGAQLCLCKGQRLCWLVDSVTVRPVSR